MTRQTDLLTVADVATTMKTTTLNVMLHIKRGLLVGEEIEGMWYVQPASLSSFLNNAAGAARGSLCKSTCGHGCSSCG